MTNEDEIRRHIENRFHEDHPFQHGKAGMEAFRELLDLLPQCTEEDFFGNIEKIKPLFGKLKHCESCAAKLWMFLSLFLAYRRPEVAAENRRQALVISLCKMRLSDTDDLGKQRTLLLNSKPTLNELRQFIRQAHMQHVTNFRDYETEVLKYVGLDIEPIPHEPDDPNFDPFGGENMFTDDNKDDEQKGVKN